MLISLLILSVFILLIATLDYKKFIKHLKLCQDKAIQYPDTKGIVLSRETMLNLFHEEAYKQKEEQKK